MKNSNMGRLLGSLLLVGGVIVSIIVIVLMTTYRSEGRLSAGGMVLGIALGLIILVLPQFGFGIFLLWRGGQDAQAAATAAKQRQLLDMVQTRGQIAISDLVIELNSTRDNVQQMIRQLVGMGLFSGYINWDEGMLYSVQARQLREMTNCLNCNGKLELAGHGVIHCPYCGAEYFLE